MTSKRKIIDYKILREYYSSDLTRLVNEYIQDGYELRGVLIITSNNDYIQVMVKYAF